MPDPSALSITSLGSGSQGNATVVRSQTTTILIDCGFSRRQIEIRLFERGIDLRELDGLLITHEHGDHWRGAPQLAKQDGIPIYTSAGTADALAQRTRNDPHLERCIVRVQSRSSFTIGDLDIRPIRVPHDASEPTQFVIGHNGKSFGLLTDIGSIPPAVVSHYANLDALLLEANHDLDMLHQGDYPPPLKERVGGDYGHLNNLQSRSFFEEVNQPRLNNLVLGHMSLNNNTEDHVRRSFEGLPSYVTVTLATQESGTDWIEV